MTQRINILRIILGLIFMLISCDSIQKKLTYEQMVENYFFGLNTGDFNLFSNCISDSVLTTEMECVLTQNRNQFYQQFQWDSVFRPKYKLTDLRRNDDSVKAIVSKKCKRIEFLQDSALTYKILIVFKEKQIKSIQITEYVFMDFAKWQPRRDTLLAWIDKKHPELSGFSNDLTLKGAQNYMKAIDLYRNEK